VGLSQKLIFREKWSRPLPFGPYLTLGAFLWVFTGPAIWFWYLGIFRSALGKG
jgi:prepilin signal peptidase PulO-like enzyme (type II secretory pathway)